MRKKARARESARAPSLQTIYFLLNNGYFFFFFDFCLVGGGGGEAPPEKILEKILDF